MTSSREAVFDALRIAAPGAVREELRRPFLAGEVNLRLADLGMDSLARMEFCIAIELATSVSLSPSQLGALGSTDAVEQRIRDALR